MSNNKVTWSGDGTLHGITVLAGIGAFPNEKALTNVTALDPAHFEEIKAGEQFDVNFSDEGSWSYQFPNAPWVHYDSASASISGSASTTIGGYGNLFSYSIVLEHDGDHSVAFSSNPSLGLNDVAIAAQIDAGYQWDFYTASWDYNGPGIAVSFAASSDMAQGAVLTRQEATLNMAGPPCTTQRGGIGSCIHSEGVVL